MTPTTDQLKDLLAKVTPDWRADGMTCDDPRMIGSLLRIKTSEFHSIFVAAWTDNEKDASEARANATLIALAPTLAAEVVRLRQQLLNIAELSGWASADDLGEIARQALDATSAT